MDPLLSNAWYAPSGTVVHAFEKAVAEEGFQLFWGPDAKHQSPDMGDILLHETAVALFRARMRKEQPVVEPWRESRLQVGRFLQMISSTHTNTYTHTHRHAHTHTHTHAHTPNIHIHTHKHAQVTSLACSGFVFGALLPCATLSAHW